MKYKRILAGSFALALTLPLLTVSAHPGRTDGNGGHTDSDTGDYHFHHGYEAHAHFDIDGDGTIDCPFDFDDQTGTRSGTTGSSGIYTPGDGSKDGYQEGYADGYEQGELDGWTDGYVNSSNYFNEELARLEGDYTLQLQQQEERSSKQFHDLLTTALWVCGLLAVLFFGSVFLLRSHEKSFKAKLRQKQEVYANDLNRLSLEYDSQISELKSDHAAEIRRLKLRYINFKRLEVLERIAQGKDDSIELPEGVALRPSYTPIRGKTSKNYPYGSYTVFLTVIGKTYHCKHDCIPKARPTHFFDLPDGATPCRKCVPADMLPQPLPDWYIKLREKLDSIVTADSESTPSAPPANANDEPQVQFSIRS